jgi:hypothetical protein
MNEELEMFLELIQEWQQQDCVEFITDLMEQHPELVESLEVQRQIKQ